MIDNDKLLELKARRSAKNTIFLDLFSIPEYQLQLLQALHPEMTDVTEADIKLITLNPVILNRDYNDLGLLVRDKLIILIEAQSTWTINILVRILLYLASTYHDYITDKKLNLYSSKIVKIPEPEFYVVYTGDKKFVKDTISLKEDFWNNPDSKLDLIAKVIYTENKNDIIGQYIIFCHVLDEQIRLYGRNKLAVVKTFEICQNDEVLKAYLETRKKEVITIMDLLFSDDFILEAYGLEKWQEGEAQGRLSGRLQGMIETCKKLGTSIGKTIKMVAESLGLSEEESAKYVHEFWDKA